MHQAAAYYYHGLILDEGNTEKSKGMAVAALQAADEYFKESKNACEVFNAAHPLSRLWHQANLSLLGTGTGRKMNHGDSSKIQRAEMLDFSNCCVAEVHKIQIAEMLVDFPNCCVAEVHRLLAFLFPS
ncbi:hypothetical protein CRYUN_Cryun12cG0132500 [Craigia yunnanensis]